MADHAQGTVLTCAHGECGCRIRIEAECHCETAGADYVCTCGSPMVEVTDGARVGQWKRLR
jgi:hypothetical protein